MRIAFVTTSYPSDEGDPSGHFVRAEARARAREGHDVVVVAPLARSPSVRDGVRVVAVSGGEAFGWPGVSSRLRASPGRIVHAASWVAGARRVLHALDAERPLDRIVAHWCVPSAWPVAAGLGGRVEVVSHGGDIRLLLAMSRSMRRAVVRRVIDVATDWRFVSLELLHDLSRALDVDQRALVAEIARILPSPFEMPHTDALRVAAARCRASFDGAVAYAAVGRLTPSKRVDRIVTYVAEKARDLPRAPLLVVVGDGPERARLEATAHQRRVHARFLGRVDRSEALAWMAAAGTLLFASEREGRPTVLREAEGLGVAVEFVP